MTTFHDAMARVIAELTPQPWEYTAPDGTTLTVIPAGLRADAGEAEIYVRITASKTLSAEIGITTADMPALLAALDADTAYQPWSLIGDGLTTEPTEDDGVILTVTEARYEDGRRTDDAVTTIRIPNQQRLPLRYALDRAADVARSWEDDAQ